ncbi:hypothetical protein F2P81_015602 [Scophthalmus maximus]|uniref:Uncharacterized protein n=1 Tax=Scophthalmus maximus TaxID=52904 RepID=A0A6A4SCV1_SCOMX|nr:hypothetical protein F2P81_015602 [Scophthalmus maximus]
MLCYSSLSLSSAEPLILLSPFSSSYVSGYTHFGFPGPLFAVPAPPRVIPLSHFIHHRLVVRLFSQLHVLANSCLRLLCRKATAQHPPTRSCADKGHLAAPDTFRRPPKKPNVPLETIYTTSGRLKLVIFLFICVLNQSNGKGTQQQQQLRVSHVTFGT